MITYLAVGVIGFSIGYITTHLLIVVPMRKMYRNKLEEAVIGWGQTLMLLNKVTKSPIKKEPDGSVISPLQVGREGS